MKMTKSNGMIDIVLEETDEVVPCPFCGCKSIELAHTHTPSYWINCTDCGAEVKGDWGEDLVIGCTPDDEEAQAEAHLASAADALERWNNRVEVRS